MKNNFNSIKLVSKYHKNKLYKKILPIFGLSSLFVVPPSLVFSFTFNNEFINSNVLKNSNLSNDGLSVTIDNPDKDAFQNQIKPLVPSYVNYVNRLVSTNVGPIVHYNNELVSLDWFGAERWKIDTVKYAPNNGVGLDKTWDRAWLNIALDRKNNHIWMLTNGSTNTATYRQKLIQISVIDGTILSENTIPNAAKLFFNIIFLESGKVMVFDDRETSRFTPRYVLFDPKSSSFETKTGNIGDTVSTPTEFPGSYMFFANVIPIAKNRNIVMVINFPNRGSSGDGGSTSASSNIYFILADDNLNKVTSTGYWSTGHVAVKGLPGYRNSKIWPQMDYYKLLDGRTVAMIYNSLVVINPNDALANDQNNTSFKTYSTGDKWIMSWSFDTRERLYFKFKDDSKIYQIQQIPPPDDSSTSISISDYYDLNSSQISDVRKNANSFIIYAVHGYSGALILINSYFSEVIKKDQWPSESVIQTNQYGLALGIVPNETNPNVGDTKGLLNTASAFQFSADFTIQQTILDTKLPSEITQNDLTLLNKGFFTTNVDKDSNGQIKYPPFIKKDINDKNKSLTIEVNLDQIPWFTDKLPQDSIPLKITKTFQTKENIDSRIKWKAVNEDYDFKNTLPSKVDKTDLERFNPFLIDLVSQKVMKDNQQLYPKKEYTTTSTNDDTGVIGIQVTYTYMPLGVAIDKANELQYSFSENFTIFKKTDPKQFKWNTENQNDQSTTSNISNIPSLKKFIEANILPSSIQATKQGQLLDFIDLNGSSGYPISKMQAIVTPNDQSGSLSLNLTLPKDYYDEGEKSFTHIYTNLNKISDYQFSYKTPNSLTQPTNSMSTDYSKTLPSQVTEEQIFSDFVSYSGYDGLDLITTLLPNDANGTLTVQIELTNNYPISVATINGFNLINNKYISKKTFNNFLTTTEFQKQYVVGFKDNNDRSLIDIKNLQVSVILNGINNGGLNVGGNTYKSSSDLIELFIKSKGVRIPKIKDSNVKIYGDDQSGILTFELIFSEAETGLDYPLSFTQTFTGFLQGVAVPTKDIFIFKNQDSLLSSLLNKLPTEIEEELRNDPTKIKNYFVETLVGEFEELIKNSNNYTITTYANDLTGTLGITIEFKNIKDPNTLKLYSKSYTGFKKIL